jgi:hypothetical protein
MQDKICLRVGSTPTPIYHLLVDHIDRPHFAFLQHLFLVALQNLLSLGLNTLLSPLAGSLGLCALGVHLLLEQTLTLLLGLGLVNLV